MRLKEKVLFSLGVIRMSVLAPCSRLPHAPLIRGAGLGRPAASFCLGHPSLQSREKAGVLRSGTRLSDAHADLEHQPRTISYRPEKVRCDRAAGPPNADASVCAQLSS